MAERKADIDPAWLEEDQQQFEIMYAKWYSPAVKAVKPLMLVGFTDSKKHALFFTSGAVKDRSLALEVRQVQELEAGCRLERFDSIQSKFMKPVLSLKTFEVSMPKFTGRKFKILDNKGRLLLTTKDDKGATVFPYAMILRAKSGVQVPKTPADLEYVRFFARTGRKEEITWIENC